MYTNFRVFAQLLFISDSSNKKHIKRKDRQIDEIIPDIIVNMSPPIQS